MFRALAALAGITVIIGSLLFPSSARAADTGPMPRNDYPTPAKIQVVSPLDNPSWDCAIAFDCSVGAPLIHSSLSDDLGRVSGWGIVSTSHHANLEFIDTSNTFQAGMNTSGVQWNQAALDDETATMPSWQVAHAVKLALPPLPGGVRTLTWRIGANSKQAGMLFVSAAWGNTAEVELFAVYSKRYAKQAQRLILAQLRDILTAAPAGPVPTPTPAS